MSLVKGLEILSVLGGCMCSNYIAIKRIDNESENNMFLC